MTPLPMLPLPLSIYTSPLLLTYPFLFHHHPTYIYIHQRRFYTYPASLFCFIPALSPYPPFRFFGIFYGCSLATSTISHPYTLTIIVFPSSLTPAWPVPSPSPCLLPLHPFRFFDTFYGCSPATSTIPHHYILTTIILPSPLSMPDPSHPPAPACPPPYPPFSLFWAIYGRFFVYIYMLFHLYMYIHDLWH